MAQHHPTRCPLDNAGHTWVWQANVTSASQRKKKPILKPAGMYRCACGASSLGKTKRVKPKA